MLTPIERQAIMDEVEAGNFDLGDALDDIATKQRGEDVRRAMYGGILLTNHEGKAGAVDVKARQKMELLKTDVGKQIDALQKQMGTFIANNSGALESTLIENTTLAGTAVTLLGFASQNEGAEASASISLADSITNYYYIEIEYTVGGRTQIARFTPAQIRQVVHWSEQRYNASNNLASVITEDTEGGGGSGTITYYPYSKTTSVMFKASYSSTTVLDVTAYKWTWSGKKDDYGYVASNITAEDGIKIMRVVGVKHTKVNTPTKDAELSDLRVGYDDTEYSSAGEAVRAQIAALWEAVNAINANAVMVDENGYLRFDGGDET